MEGGEWQGGKAGFKTASFEASVVWRSLRSAHTCAYCMHLSMQTEAHTMTLAYCIITLEHSHCVKCARRPIDGAPTGEGFIRCNFPPLSPSARSQRPNRVVFIYEIKAILPLHM